MILRKPLPTIFKKLRPAHIPGVVIVFFFGFYIGLFAGIASMLLID